MRVGAIANPSGKPIEDNTVIYRAIWASLLTQKNKAAAEFVQKLLKGETIKLLQQRTKMKDLLIQVKKKSVCLFFTLKISLPAYLDLFKNTIFIF